jgi:gliding motility-associated transport system ATP-binding protein
MNQTPLAEARNLARLYGGLYAVRDVDLTVRRGEVLALLGPNGAGKTTILSMLTGNLAPHAGSIRIGGYDLIDNPRAAKRTLGYLPETPPVYPEMSVTEYLRYCARLRGVPRSALGAAVTVACERTGLAAERRRLIGHLSKGYRQRVGIAQAIVHRPTVIVLDEPTVGLDPIQAREVQTLVGSLVADAAVIVSTHLLGEASEMATRVAILNRGALVYESPVGAAAHEPLRLRLELARPPALNRLREVAGVAAIEMPASGTFVITATVDADPREALVRAALAGNWGILGIAPYRASLEELFVAIATGARAALS